MTFFRRSTFALILTVLLTGWTRGQTSPDSTLLVVRSLYVSGAYAQAELEARRLLDNDLAGDSLRVVAEKWVAFALVAQGRPAMAKEHFLDILHRQPLFDLDPIQTSPKILAVFYEARAAFMTMRHAAVEPAAEWKPFGGITVRTILFPGWEQLHQGRTTTGFIFFGAGIASLGTGIALEFVRSNARTKYLEATRTDEIETRYRSYDRAQKAELWAFAAFAAVYLASEIEVFAGSASVSVGPPEHSAARAGALLTVTLR